MEYPSFQSRQFIGIKLNGRLFLQIKIDVLEDDLLQNLQSLLRVVINPNRNLLLPPLLLPRSLRLLSDLISLRQTVMPLDGPKELPGAVHESVPQFVAVVLAELLLIRVVGLHVQDAYFLFLDDFYPGQPRLLVGQLREAED